LWINQLYRPIRQLADKFNVLQRGTVRAERIFEILDVEEHIQQTGTRTDIDFNSAISWFSGLRTPASFLGITHQRFSAMG
jgi:ATP-binding cassette subfamily B protein